MKTKKSYLNVILIGVIAIAALIFVISRNLSFNDFLLTIGYFNRKITIANTSDVHGHIVFNEETGSYWTTEEVNVIMGLPLISTLYRNMKKADPNILLFDCGDLFHGTADANIDQGKPVLDTVNLMDYNGMVPGNHEFDYGFTRLKELRDNLQFPVLASNIYQDDKRVFMDYKIFTVNDIRVGVFGLAYDISIMFSNGRDIAGVKITDPAIEAKRVVNILKPQTDVIVVISHLGDENDRKVIDAVAGINVVLCGHHHYLYDKPEIYKGVYLTNIGGYTSHIGRSDLYFRNNRFSTMEWRIIQSRDKTKAEPQADKIAQEYHKLAMENNKEVVGTAAVKLDGVRYRLRTMETNLADMVTDAMRNSGETDFAMMNGGGIRESIQAGDITLYKVANCFPFINSLVTLEMSGEDIYKAVERGLRNYPYGAFNNGGFLQVSGLKIVFDGTKPAGERLVKLSSTDNTVLDKTGKYKVATNDYLFNGGDFYEEFKRSKLLSRGKLLCDVVADYIRSRKVISQATEGRIINLTAKDK